METKKKVIMALLVLSIILSIFSVIISMNASSVNSNNAQQPIRQIIRVQGSSGQVQLEVEPQTAPQGGSTNG